MHNNNSSSRGGINVGGILGIVFVVLKLCGIIHWSWLWVLSPFWIGFLLWVIVIAVIEVLERNELRWRMNKIKKMSKK